MLVDASELYDEVADFLASILNHRDFALTPLRGEGTNIHYLVESHQDSSTYFLKLFVTNSLQVVNRQQQYDIQKQLADLALSPEPVALSECQRFWLEEWCVADDVPGATFETLSVVDRVVLLANVIAKIHQCSISAPLLDLEAEWSRYLSMANADENGYQSKMARLLSDYQRLKKHCFCHNDLHLSHILQSNPLRVVDWEYAAIGNRYFDLAACFRVNQIHKNHLELFARQYALSTGISTEIVIENIALLLPVVDFTNDLWHNAYNRLNKPK